MRSWLLAFALPGCVWLGDDELDRFVDPDGDGEPALTFDGRDCFPDDPDRTVLRCHADADGDGYGDPNAFSDDACACAAPSVENGLDCDDGDEARNPDTRWYLDEDGDGHGGVPGDLGCTAPEGQVAQPDDCDDGDDGVGDTSFRDDDQDGWGLDPIAGCGGVPRGGDCDDTIALVNPGTQWYVDEDGDSWGTAEEVGEPSCTPPNLDSAPRTGDCDDTDPGRRPDGFWYLDGDGDGLGDPGAQRGGACGPEPLGPEGDGGLVTNGNDCDDGDPTFLDSWFEATDDADGDGFAADTALAGGTCAPNQPRGPGAVPGGDCDDADDTRDPTTAWYPDVDSDGHGARVGPIVQCESPSAPGGPYPALGGYVADVDDDCDDADANVHGGRVEVAGNGLDEDCDAFDLLPACPTPRRLDVDPTTIDAELLGLAPGACVELRLAPGTYGALTVPGGVDGVTLAGDAFGEVVVDGSTVVGRTAIFAGSEAIQLEHLRLTGWDEGVIETSPATVHVGLRGVDVERSGPALRERVLQGEELGLEVLRLREVAFVDGNGLARPIVAEVLDVSGLTFDGAISSVSLLGVRNLGPLSLIERVTVRRSAVTGPLVSLGAAPGTRLDLSDVTVVDSLGGAGVVATSASGVGMRRVRVEDDTFAGGLGALAIGATGGLGGVTLEQASVRRNTVDDALLTPDQWVALSGAGEVSVDGLEIVGNQSRGNLSLLRTKRAEPSLAAIRLRHVALHAADGTAIVLEDAGPVTVEHATVAGFDAGSEVVLVVDGRLGPGDQDDPVVDVTGSVFVTDQMPGGVTIDPTTIVLPGFDPDLVPFVAYAPFVHREYVDLRWAPVARGGEVGAYTDLESTCDDAWDVVDDCERDAYQAVGDGLYDSWERLFFGTTDEDGTGDRDGDLLPDGDELAAGTVPVDDDTDDDGHLDGDDGFPLDPGAD